MGKLIGFLDFTMAVLSSIGIGLACCTLGSSGNVIKSTAWAVIKADFDILEYKAYFGVGYYTIACDGDGFLNAFCVDQTEEMPLSGADKYIVKYALIVGAVFGGLKVRAAHCHHARGTAHLCARMHSSSALSSSSSSPPSPLPSRVLSAEALRSSCCS